MTVQSARLAAVACAALLTWSCGGPTEAPGRAVQSSGRSARRPVVLPDLTRVDGSVREQIREREATLQEVLARSTATDAEQAAAFGGVAVLLHASEFYEAAEPAYLNAQDLAPTEAKWPYLLAHLRKSRGEPAKAIADLTRVVELSPNDVAGLVWLGRMYMDQGEAEKADPLFVRARDAAPGTVAALLGLGQTALARKDFSAAISVLEEALRVDPGAASLHSPLAMAYRGLGDRSRAEAHLREWRNTEVLVPDPVRLELDLALQSSLSFELRGVRALEARDFKAAADFFRQGVAITVGTVPLGRSLRHKLGTALFMSGDLPGAVALFRETVRLAPKAGRDETAAKAHYSLGVLMASAGLGPMAIAHLRSAVSYNPNYVEALQALGDALRRAGRVNESLEPYQEALRANPRFPDARLGYGMALVRLGRYTEARAWFEEAVTSRPDQGELKHVLARLLVASPEDGARTGIRGLGLVQELLASTPERTTALGETFAMALAETGDYTQAASVQRDVLAAAGRAGQGGDVRRMTRNLRLYVQRRPCREPWSQDDPVHAPGPPIDPALRSLMAAAG